MTQIEIISYLGMELSGEILMVQENPQFLLFNNNLLFFYLFMAIIGFKVTRTIVPQNIAAGTTICNCST
jgi:hypothetical protein